MKVVRIVLLISLVVLVFSGCLKTKTTVNVKKDGSGTVEFSFLMKKEFVQMLQGIQGQVSEGKPFTLVNEEEFAERSADMGEGVAYLSAAELKTDWGEGYTASYSFEDINKIRVNTLL